MPLCCKIDAARASPRTRPAGRPPCSPLLLENTRLHLLAVDSSAETQSQMTATVGAGTQPQLVTVKNYLVRRTYVLQQRSSAGRPRLQKSSGEQYMFSLGTSCAPPVVHVTDPSPASVDQPDLAIFGPAVGRT
jgi:hypothetical protein